MGIPMATKPVTQIVSYLRVSTGRQGQSGLGLEAQREAVARYAADKGLEIAAEFVEVHTGKDANALAKRPQLLAALALAKKLGARLVAAKLDRLARNVHFISGLMETGVNFAVADMPDADAFQLHIYAALGQQEGKAISQRTKDALAAAKAKGTVLGSHGAVLAARNKAEAVERVVELVPILADLKERGLTMRKMVAELNERGIPSAAGGQWHLANLDRALKRLKDGEELRAYRLDGTRPLKGLFDTACT